MGFGITFSQYLLWPFPYILNFNVSNKSSKLLKNSDIRIVLNKVILVSISGFVILNANINGSNPMEVGYALCL